jgi:F0F1-type ATP synthase assembly protein I
MRRALKALAAFAVIYGALWIVGLIGWLLEAVFNLAPTFFGILMLIALGWGFIALLLYIGKELS